jgi:hypothetical protein
MTQLQNVLLKLANQLNKHNLTWALGASMLLYYHGIVSTMNDIDIMILEEDEETVKKIIKQLGNIKHHADNLKYVTKVFIEAEIDGVEIDVIGGFTIKTSDKIYYCPLQSDKITCIEIQGVTIYLDSLKLWEKYYYYMGRIERSNLIKNHLTTTRI